MLSNSSTALVLSCLATVITGCSGSGGSGDGGLATNGNSGVVTGTTNTITTAAPDLLGEIPAGEITSYGAITVGDDAGMASDLVASFFKLNNGLSGDFLETVFSSNQTLCTVDDDDRLDFEEISAGFIPSFNGVSKQAISAGETITLTSDAGTFANMEIQTVGAFLFYTLPDMQMLPSGPVPQKLQVDVTGDVFPAYQGAMLPSVEPLDKINFTGGNTVKPTSVFSWTPATESGAMIRIFSSTEGGFFLEDGKTVTCLTPDTGSFSFPASVQSELGADFVGGMPIFSRVSVRTESTESSTLFLIRESFAE